MKTFHEIDQMTDWQDDQTPPTSAINDEVFPMSDGSILSLTSHCAGCRKYHNMQVGYFLRAQCWHLSRLLGILAWI
jgi:hypothetical protein